MDSFSYYKTLYEIAREVNSSLSVEHVLKAVMESVTKALNVKGCSVMLLSPDRSRLIHTAAYGLSDWYINKGPITTDVVITTTLEGQPVQILDVKRDIRLHYRDQAIKEGVASILTIPIRLGSETIGVVAVYSAIRREFSEEEIEFLRAVANLGAVALDRARAHEHLSSEHTAILNDLEFRKKELARVEEAKNQLMRFISIVAHDLKAPLAAIQSFNSVLLGGYSGPLNDKQKQMLERSSHRITGLLELISDLLDISRIELGQAFQEPKCVLPLEVMKTPLEDCTTVAQQKNITIEVKVPADLPGIMISPSRLQQVFANLLSNAVKFTHEGGHVCVSARRDDDDKIRFEVSDTGIGIPPQDLPRIFEEFFRASNVQAQDKNAGQVTGTGLGLAIVRRILEKYGGRIWVESPNPDTGCGTKFTFLLPTCRTNESGKGGGL